MVCKTTSSNKFKAAVTLVEMMVGIGVGSIVFAALAALTLYSARSFSSMVNYSDLNKENRMALDGMSKEIRQSRGLIKSTPTFLSFKIDGGELSYTYNKTNQTLIETETKLGVIKVSPILKNCISWTNVIFQQTPPQLGGTNFTITTDAALCKMVRLSWVCNTGASSSATNSQSVQSMSVVIRKKS